MKKNSQFFLNGSFFALLLFCSHLCGMAQSNSINVAVGGIEYDDPNFSLLKESVQKDKTVTAVKTSYDNGTAKLSCTSTHKAPELWDALPQAIKQYFKVTTINDNNIILVTKAAESSTVKKNTTASNAGDCSNCYFNMCKYDGTKSFQGMIYKAVNYDNGTYYYNCDNGVLTSKVITVNGYGVTTNITTDTILMSNVPIGTTWHVIDNETDFFGIKGYNHFKYTLVAKGISKTIKGKTYNDVLVVNAYRNSKDNITGADISSVNNFYAKSIGFIGQENVDPNTDPAATIHTPGKVAALPAISGMQGVIDPDLVGTWVDADPSGFTYTYKFYADGMFETFVGSTLSYSGSKCFWRLDGAYLNLYCTGWPRLYRQEFKKKNDPVSGKPAVVIQFNDTEYRTYISEDGKAPWKK